MGTPKCRFCTAPPLELPLDSARHAPGTVRGHVSHYAGKDLSMRLPAIAHLVGARFSRAAPGQERLFFLNLPALVLLFARLFACALSSQRGFHSFLFARLQVKGVSLDLLDNVLLLHLALEAA